MQKISKRNSLKNHAAKHSQSTETEVPDGLDSAIKPEQCLRLGDALAILGQKIGLTNKDFEIFNQVRDTTPAKPLLEE